MQVNCSINHTLKMKSSVMMSCVSSFDDGQTGAHQRSFVGSFVSRKSIENYLNAHTSNTTELN